ncbi:CBS domain-containing protein [Sphingomonas sp. LaA6.9]|uniref:CBS domain-containing protein n=1 Tax=Sphingomonas sp. LaA6.9 TaxID=2919914 RepID=UPI001F4FFFAE|nr:CBS domain-containing protein [Sphingomonas sp. LaA6.9]MCJ8158346.1 CBS domain-containing protein [Sphingomonas sp. LaA6.9]
MTIQAILERNPHPIISITGKTSVAEAVSLLAAKRIGALPVVEGDAVLGIFSERDVIYSLEREGAAALDRPVAEVMTAPAVTSEPETTALGALSLMTQRRIRHLPVIEGGRMVGFISIGDLVKYRIDKIEAEANAMLEYIQSV